MYAELLSVSDWSLGSTMQVISFTASCQTRYSDKILLGAPDQDTPETYLARAAATAARFKRETINKSFNPGSSETSATLFNREHGGGRPGEDKVAFGATVCIDISPV